nr:amidohydrolase [bacterium]
MKLDTLIQNVRLTDGRQGAWYIGIADGAIACMGPMADCPPASEAARVENRPGCIAIAGLQNAHSHVAMTLLRGQGGDLPLARWLNEAIFPLEDRLDEEAVYWGAKLGMLEMLSGGITFFADMYMMMDAVAQAAVDTGMRAELCRGLTSGEDEQGKLAGALDFADRWTGAGDGRITCALGPHAEYTTTEGFLKEIAAAARQSGLPVHVHASETRDEVAGCVQRHGVSPIAYLQRVGLLGSRTRLAHCVAVDGEDIALLAESRALAVHCPGSNLKLASGIAPISRMQAAGVRLALGTDGPASDNRQDMMRAMYLCAVLQKGITGDAQAGGARQALDMACAGACLAPGLPADIVLINGQGLHLLPEHDALSTVVYAAGTSDVVMTMIAGHIRYLDGAFPGIDVEQTVRMARMHQQKLLRGKE